jgi:hypothetical protein
MPRVIDFEQTARTVLAAHGLHDDPQLTAAIAEQLRLVWNQRGATDFAKVESELSRQMGPIAAAPYLTTLDRALRFLNR